MKQAVIISCFDNYSYEVRVKYIEKYLIDNGFLCKIIAADFNHRKKEPYVKERKNLVLLHVPPYQKNLSLARIKSHKVFAELAVNYIEQSNPELIFVCTPPNFLFKYLGKYKKRNNCCLVYQIGDMWPETLPVSSRKKLLINPILQIWASIRNKYLKYADGIIFECNLFKDYLNKYTDDIFCKTIYLCKDNSGYCIDKNIGYESDTKLHFLYLGSLNNIIDCDFIVDILRLINSRKKCVLEIIGDGENKNLLFELCNISDIEYIYYGIVYDEKKKEKIISKCHFAFNVMKSTVFVGATMKSLDYFYYGIPIINTIAGDTFEIIEQNGCGFNVNQNNIEWVVEQLLNMDKEQWNTMRQNAQNVYLTKFDSAVMRQELKLYLDELLQYSLCK